VADYLAALLDLFYPPKCPVCKTGVEEQGAWCPACLRKIVSVREIRVVQHQLVALDSCRVVCEYTGVLKRLIHDMKFRRQRKVATCLGWLIGEYIEHDEYSFIDGVLPVPLHWQRLAERGYNQSECIFESWVMKRNMNWMPGVLVRNRHTIPQWELNHMARQTNIKDAFVLRDAMRVKNKNILLVDDIVTTGMTFDECAKVLKQGGASQVHALAVASGADTID